jgi:hypothetical protein
VGFSRAAAQLSPTRDAIARDHVAASRCALPTRSGIIDVSFRVLPDQPHERFENARSHSEHNQAVAAAQAAGLPVEEMTGRLAETTQVDENDLRALAQERAQHVRDYFINVGKISGDRLFLSKATTAPAGQTEHTGKGPRVFLELQ